MPHARGLLSARSTRRGGGLQAASTSSSSGLSAATSREPIDPIAGMSNRLGSINMCLSFIAF